MDSVTLYRSEIDEILDKLANDIDKRMMTAKKRDKPFIAIGVLCGAYIFHSELTRRISSDIEIDFVRINTYDKNKKTQNIKIQVFDEQVFKDRNIIVIEDIIETGHTIDVLIKYFKQLGVNEIITVSLLSREKNRQQNVQENRLIGHYLNNDIYVYGYGLDNDKLKRNYNSIYQLNK